MADYSFSRRVYYGLLLHMHSYYLFHAVKVARSAENAAQTTEQAWAQFRNWRIKEWKRLNSIAMLILVADVTFLLIPGVGCYRVTCILALVSFICAFWGRLYGYLMVARYDTKDVEADRSNAKHWRDKVAKDRADMQWWIELSMPAVWTAWGIFFFACTMLCFVWRTGPADGRLDMSFGGWVVLAVVFFAPGINFAKHHTAIISGVEEHPASNERKGEASENEAVGLIGVVNRVHRRLTRPSFMQAGRDLIHRSESGKKRVHDNHAQSSTHGMWKNIPIDPSTITNINYASETKDILSTLKPVYRSSYHAQPCMEGTRLRVLREIDAWLEDVNQPNILWISGRSGAGKSTIASTLVSRLSERRRMGSFFAFDHRDAMLSDPAAVWRTVAHDLACFDASFASILVDILKGGTVDPAIPDIASHFQSLIVDPLTKRHKDSPPRDLPVIVIDALDECGPDFSQSAQRKVFLDTVAHWLHLPVGFRLIVTGRNEPGFDSLRSSCRQIELDTGGSASTDGEQDIRLFLEQHFAGIGLTNWPSGKDFDTLAVRAEGLFIWAATIVRFLEQGLPKKRLAHVLGGMGKGDNITELYRQILELSFQTDDVHLMDAFQQVMTAVILAKIPLHIDDVAELTSQPKSLIKFILDKLSSVISVTHDMTIRIHHVSFVAFICSPNKCPDQYYIDRHRGSWEVSMTCFRLMNKGLKFNICNLQTSHIPNSCVDGLSDRIMENISGSLLYACQFWAAHLQETLHHEDQNGVLIMDMQNFFYNRFLYWLEVMSVTEHVAVAITALLSAADWIQPLDMQLSDFIRDGSQFIVKFLIPISESTPHIYLSALPFAPEDSLITKHYRSQFVNTLWTVGINFLQGHNKAASSIAFSPCSGSKQITSGSFDEFIRVWDAELGEIVSSPFKDHIWSVCSVGFSPDGKWLASGSDDKSIRIWDISNGQIVSGPFKGHTGSVHSVTFSPDGTRLVSGSGDKSICIWDAHTGDFVSGPLEGHTGSVNSVTFLPDGTRIASASDDQTIRVWDAQTGVLLLDPLEGHMGSVNSVAFSPDGQQIASASDDQTICIWDAHTGNVVSGPFEGHTGSVNSIAFSPNGQLIASASDDQTIRIWDAHTGNVVSGPFEGHTGSVNSIAFSPDGQHIASASDDQTIRIWDAHTGNVVSGPFEGHTGSVNSVAFSPDGQQIASASDEQTICIWDARDLNRVFDTFRGHIKSIASIGGTRSLNCFSSYDLQTDVGRQNARGWVCSESLIYPLTGEAALVFWVPHPMRQGLCGMETVHMLGAQITCLDLSQFVHGTLWTQCYSPIEGLPSPNSNPTA